MGVAVLFSPFISVIYSRFLDSGIKGTWVKKVNGIESLYNMIWNFSNTPVITVLFIIILFLGFLKIIFCKHKQGILSVNILSIIFWSLLPLITSFLISFKIGHFMDRYFFFTSPGFYLCVTASISFLLHNYKKTKMIMLFTFAFLMLITFSVKSDKVKYSQRKVNTRLVSSTIMDFNKNSNSVVIICPKWFDKEVVYYNYRQIFQSYFQDYDKEIVFKEPLKKYNIYPASNYYELNLSNSIENIMYVDKACSFHCPDNGILNYLSSNFQLVENYTIDNAIGVYIFNKKI
jgi:hypothetical protein